jgi:hypothetical protein
MRGVRCASMQARKEKRHCLSMVTITPVNLSFYAVSLYMQTVTICGAWGQSVSFRVQLSLCFYTSSQCCCFPIEHHCYQYTHCGNLQLYNHINNMSSVFCGTFEGRGKLVPILSHQLEHTRATFYSRSSNEPGAICRKKKMVILKCNTWRPRGWPLLYHGLAGRCMRQYSGGDRGGGDV